MWSNFFRAEFRLTSVREPVVGHNFLFARDPEVMKRLLEPARIALAFFNADRAAVSFGIDLFDLDDEVQGAAQD